MFVRLIGSLKRSQHFSTYEYLIRRSKRAVLDSALCARVLEITAVWHNETFLSPLVLRNVLLWLLQQKEQKLDRRIHAVCFPYKQSMRINTHATSTDDNKQNPTVI